MSMTLTFEEYFDPDLTLIRDFYEACFARYDADLTERVFVVKDGHWLIGALRIRHEEGYYHLCGLQLLPHYQQRGIGSCLLDFACKQLDNRPVLCQALPFERDFYLKVGFSLCQVSDLPEPLRSRLRQQQELGYQVEPLMREGGEPSHCTVVRQLVFQPV